MLTFSAPPNTCYIKEAMFFDWFFKPQEPNPPATVSITRDAFLATLGVAAISLGTPFDATLAITTKENLDKLAPCLVYPANLYIDQVVDCEDYALRAQVDATFKFRVSGIRLALGLMPYGYHGFIITADTLGRRWLLEPNAGFGYAGKWFKIGEHGYKPDKVLA